MINSKENTQECNMTKEDNSFNLTRSTCFNKNYLLCKAHRSSFKKNSKPFRGSFSSNPPKEGRDIIFDKCKALRALFKHRRSLELFLIHSSLGALLQNRKPFQGSLHNPPKGRERYQNTIYCFWLIWFKLIIFGQMSVSQLLHLKLSFTGPTGPWLKLSN